MSSETTNLGLLKKDPATEGADTFNIEMMLNDNWDKIDAVTGPASAGSPGVVKVGSGIDVDANGVISVPGVDVPVTSVNGETGAVTLTPADVGAATAAQGATADATATSFAIHQADYVRQPAFGPTTGSANTYLFTSTPALPALVDGVSAYLDVHAANTGASTLNWNSTGVKAIVDGKGVALIAGKMPLNGIVGVRYNASTTNFQLLGEGGDYGTAGASQTLTGFTLGTPAGIISGTIPRNVGRINAISASKVTIDLVVVPSGGSYNYNDASDIKVSQAQLIAAETNMITANIKSGASIFGVDGKASVVDTAGAGLAEARLLVAGRSAWSDGIKYDGIMPYMGVVGITPSTVNQDIAGKFYEGGSVVYGDPDLAAANILTGVNIFGIAGTAINGAGMKRYASGSGTTDGNGRYIVTGLTFKPSVVLIKYPTFGSDWSYVLVSARSALFQLGGTANIAASTSVGGFDTGNNYIIGMATSISWIAWEE